MAAAEVSLDEWLTAQSAAAWIVTRSPSACVKWANEDCIRITARYALWARRNRPFEDFALWDDLLLKKCRNGEIRATGQANKLQRDIQAQEWCGLRFQTVDQPCAVALPGRHDVPTYTMLQFNRDDLLKSFPRHRKLETRSFDVNSTRWLIAPVLAMISSRDLAVVAAGNHGGVADTETQTAFAALQEALVGGDLSCYGSHTVIDAEANIVAGSTVGKKYPPDDRPGLPLSVILDSRPDLGYCLVPIAGLATADRREIWFDLQFKRDDVMRLWPPVPAEIDPIADSAADLAPEPSYEDLVKLLQADRLAGRSWGKNKRNEFFAYHRMRPVHHKTFKAAINFVFKRERVGRDSKSGI